MRFALVPDGTFSMGSPEGRPFSFRDEMPVHQVRLTRPFYLGVFEVTEEQWDLVMGESTGGNRPPGAPAQSVSYDRAMAFVAAMNRMEGTMRYRLPTEAEWERAARGGSVSDYFFGDGPEELAKFAWYNGNSGGSARPVGQLLPNPYGLFDILGNVFEWTSDAYDEFYYEVSPMVDPVGPQDGRQLRSVRGCAFDMDYFPCRSADRGNLTPHEKLPNQGFRVAYTAE
ncbi:MAG: formylglycine-generating enzyme family protein [Deltaproteobacteria bacterium]|jgi:formylglycine-generating enzyme required for sulfatase activity|nr:formylglycine-generating enzyme family protein [Deltaproteobacteria bacterium]